MRKGYKVSVHHYLNKTTVKPAVENGVRKYPIYLYTTIMRRTIHRPSRISGYFAEDEFEKDALLRYMMESEMKDIEAIGGILIDDYANDRINKKLKFLSDRGFTSKDEFVNCFNSYLEFYMSDIKELFSMHVADIVDSCISLRLQNALDMSMINDSDRDDIFKQLRRRIKKQLHKEFCLKNLDGTPLALCYISEKIKEDCNLHLPRYRWYTDKTNVLKDIIGTIQKKSETDGCFDFSNLAITRPYIKDLMTPILDRILQPNYTFLFN